MTDIDIKLPALMQLCLDENDRRFAHYDHRLRRPTTMPNLVRTGLAAYRAWDKISRKVRKRRRQPEVRGGKRPALVSFVKSSSA